MVRTYLLFWFVFFSAIAATAQTEEHVMYGHAYINNDAANCRYKLVFTLAGKIVNGYSITSENGVDMKAAIHGTFDKKKQTFNFIETKMGASEPAISPCYFDVKMKWTQSKGHTIFTGTFIGHKADGNYCDDGTVKFDIPMTQDPLYAVNPKIIKEIPKNEPPKEPKKEPVKEPSKPVAAAEPEKETKEMIKVTADMPREFTWKTDSCVLEIWDGEVADGDVVTVLFNGQHILNSYTLTTGKKRIVLPLGAKTNKLEIIAEAEGKAPPNTAQILLTDGFRTYSLLSRIHNGEKATVTLRKK